MTVEILQMYKFCKDLRRAASSNCHNKHNIDINNKYPQWVSMREIP